VIKKILSISYSVAEYSVLYKKHFALILISGTIGIAVAIFQSGQELESDTSNDLWYLPEKPELAYGSDIDTMLSKPLFGGKPVIRIKKKEKDDKNNSARKPWRLMGITHNGSEKNIVILDQGLKKPQRLLIGDILPNGEKLITIGPSFIEIETAEKTKTISLFKNNNLSEGQN
tara:strand:+ start:924 stop:1442 length:519 start_codon:yes stop_codon:yes gene_type:complete